MNPEGHDRISITVKYSGRFSLRLKVLMNASVTITWDNGENANSEVIKWKVNGWNRLEHQYSKPGKHEIEICSDEKNVITGIEIETAFSVTKMNLEACRGLEYLHCTNQLASINPKGLCGLRYLNIRNMKTKRLNIRGMHQLVALDISEIPSLRLIAEKYLPLRYFAMDGQSDLPKKTQLEENIKLNMGKIVPTIDIKRMETVHPTVFYYLRSSKWVAIRNVILKEKRMVFSIRSILESFIRCIKSYVQRLLNIVRTLMAILNLRKITSIYAGGSVRRTEDLSNMKVMKKMLIFGSIRGV